MNRREFLKAGAAVSMAGVGSAVAAPRGVQTAPISSPHGGRVLRLNYNENPLGLSPAARQATVGWLDEANRYPDEIRDRLRETLAARNGVARENVVLGNGSTEILQMIVQSASSPNATLVLADPTFEAIKRYQSSLSYRLETVPLDANFAHDIGRMRELVESRPRPTVVYLCNPNNPTGTLTASADVDAWIEEAPESVLFAVDEAYFEYVKAPGYWSAIRWIPHRPNVIVVRTFSKIHAMAGLRLGYAFAHAETARRLRDFMSSDNANLMALAAAQASLEDKELVERSRLANAKAMRVVTDCLGELELAYLPSQASFIMHRVSGDLRQYIGRMRDSGIYVGRPFAPLLDYNRLSMGIPDDMERVATTWRDFRRKGWI